MPPKIAAKTKERIVKIINAGIDAIANFTMKTTIDMNGIFISTTVTS